MIRKSGHRFSEKDHAQTKGFSGSLVIASADMAGVHRAIGKHFLLRLFEHNPLSGLTNELVAGNHSRFSAFGSGLGA